MSRPFSRIFPPVTGALLAGLLCLGILGAATWVRLRRQPTTALPPVFTRVPLTIPATTAALAAVPPSYTPALVVSPAGDTPGARATTPLPSATADRSDASTAVAAPATRTPEASVAASPSPAPTATSREIPVATPPTPATSTPAATATEPATASATPPLPPASRNPRKGIAATYAFLYADGHVPFRAGWYHTWSTFPGRWAGALEFVPMWPCHGTVEFVVGQLGADYSGYLLIMNEPDRPDQCTMSVDEGARFYLTVRQALPRARLIGPQVLTPQDGTYAGYTAAWRERIRALSGSYPQMAGYAFHVYPPFQIAAEDVLHDYCDALTAWGELGQKELWVTEFGMDNFGASPDEVRAQVRHMVELFERGLGSCQVDRYAYFTDRRVPIQGPPTPTVQPGGSMYFDLYWRNSNLLSYTGEAYRDAGNPAGADSE